MTQEELQVLAGKVAEILAAKSLGVGELEVATSLANLVSLPAIRKIGTIEKVVVAPMSLLKGVDGKDVEMRDTGTELQWRRVGGVWNTFITYSKIQKPAIDAANEVKQAINGIPEKINQLEDRLINKIGEEIDLIAVTPTHVSFREKKAGQFELNGENRDIYERTVKLEALPTAEGVTKQYIVAEEPLGYGLFFSIDAFVVSSGVGLNSSFFNQNYQIVDYTINEQLQSVITIKCIKQVNIPVEGLLKMRYCKFEGDIIEFEVTVPDGVDKEAVALEIPPLKYNKKMAFSYVTDDSYSIFQYIFSAINKRFIAKRFELPDGGALFYHLNMQGKPEFDQYVSEGYYPEYFLQYTDGAGVKKRFATSVAAWADKIKNSEGIDAGMQFPYLSEKEFEYFKDFGFYITYHDLLDYSRGMSQDEFNIALSNTANMFNQYTGITPKIMGIPSGIIEMVEYSRNNDIIQAIMASNSAGGGPNIQLIYPYRENVTFDKHKVTFKRDFHTGINQEYKDELLSKLADLNNTDNVDDIYWLIGGAHRSSHWESELLIKIHELYGDIGLDNIWVPTTDEFYEYWFMRTNARWVKTVNGDKVRFKGYVPKMPNFNYRSLSVLLDGISDLNGIEVSSGNNVYGTSFGISGNKLLVNLDFNENLPVKAEKYLTIFEGNPNKEYAYDDALYFIQQLKPGVRESYQDRLDVFTSPPTLNSVTIDGNAESTQSRQVLIAVMASGGDATHYKISESSILSGAEWKPITDSINYMLSEGYGNKTVYLQLKNNFGESEIKSDTIEYVEADLEIQGISINNGAGSTSNSIVSVLFSYIGTATHYMLSESSNFAEAAWTDMTNPANFTLSADEYGVKTIYAKLRNTATGIETTVESASITLIDTVSIILDSIEINGGDEYTGSASVVITPKFSNVPTHYRIGESANLSTQTWQPYSSGNIDYTLSGYGNKTIYVQLKNDHNESEIKSDMIEYVQSVALESVILANGESSFDEGVNVPVSLSTSGGVPTHYRAGENSNLNAVEWSPYSPNFNYNFGSIGNKTLYVQVKNQVSESDVISDSIVLTAPKIKVLLGFNANTNNVVETLSGNGETISQIRVIATTAGSRANLISTIGNTLQNWFVNFNRSTYFSESPIFIEGSGSLSSVNREAQNDSWVYPIESYKKGVCPAELSEDGKSKLRVCLSLPAGTYKIKFMWSTSITVGLSESDRLLAKYGIFQNDQELASVVCPEGFEPYNSIGFNSELEFTIEDAEKPVYIAAWSTNRRYVPGFNLLEITKLS